MGCFVSTTNFDKEASVPHVVNNSPNHSLLEEETVVKEVLSETPTSKLPVSRFSTNGGPTFPPSPNARQNFGFVKNPRMGFSTQSQSGELSEDASEICSSLGDRNEDDVTKIRNMSPGKFRNRDRMVGNSPGKRKQASPGRVRSGPGPGSGHIGDANVRRIGSGVGQGRRSTSPATRTDRTTRSMSSPGRCPSARRSSPSRVGSTRVEEDRGAKLALTNHESLENPLVSMECFIFL